MRSGQQNKRGRGRGGNNNNFNRKGANPLTRTYDSAGPDVKVRGTAQHVAEKYMSLARDAQSSGDRVMAENYLQHAEHYNRIIAAAQAQMQERFQRDDRSDNDDNDDNAAQANGNQSDDRNNDRGERNDRNERRNQRRAEQTVDADGPQPVIEGTPAEVVAETEDGQAAAGRSTRRRPAASPRPRRTRRNAEAGGESGTEAGASEAAEAAPVAAEADGEAPAAEAAEKPAPKKPARRKRTPKSEADNAPEMADAGSE